MKFYLRESTNKIQPSYYDGDIYYWDGESEVPKDVKNIIIQDNVTYIHDYAFHNCAELISVIIPDSVIDIEECAFSGCKGLINIIIPDSVISIGDFVFDHCSALTNVIIGNRVTKIGEYAFFYCTGLTSVTIGNSVKLIGYGAFRNCAGLTSIIIPNSVTKIGKTVFRDCILLTNVTIGKGVKSIGYGAFSYCENLKSINFKGDISKIKFEEDVFKNTPYEEKFEKLNITNNKDSNSENELDFNDEEDYNEYEDEEDYLEDEDHPVLVYANSSADFRDWDEAYADVKNDINDFKHSSKSGDYLIIIKAEGEAWHPIGCAAFLINKNGKIIDKTEEFSDESDYDEIEKYAEKFLNSNSLT